MNIKYPHIDKSNNNIKNIVIKENIDKIDHVNKIKNIIDEEKANNENITDKEKITNIIDNKKTLDEIIKEYFNRKNKLVLSGGGIKGISHLGVLQWMDDRKILDKFDTIIGTSIGALIGSLITIGYKPKDIFDFINLLDFKKLDGKKPDNFFKKFGLDDGNKIRSVIELMFEDRNISKNITFNELFDKTKINLIITTTCVNDKKSCYYSKDTYPNMKVIQALRMSISIPLYFMPEVFENKMYIDGGCIDNYPISYFSDNIESVFGIYLRDTQIHINDINNVEDMITHIFLSLLEGISFNSVRGYEKYTLEIIIPEDISSVDFNMNNDTKKKLFDIGYNSIINKFKNQ